MSDNPSEILQRMEASIAKAVSKSLEAGGLIREDLTRERAKQIVEEFLQSLPASQLLTCEVDKDRSTHDTVIMTIKGPRWLLEKLIDEDETKE